jgi:hypothetical protein
MAKGAGLTILAALAGLSLAACSRHEVVTYGDFRSMRPGMTYQQVAGVIGHPGSVLREGESVEGGIVPEGGKAVYVWKNKDGSNMTAAFKDDRLINMGQYDLN